MCNSMVPSSIRADTRVRIVTDSDLEVAQHPQSLARASLNLCFLRLVSILKPMRSFVVVATATVSVRGGENGMVCHVRSLL
jgi:hypothetical protein